MNVVRAFILWAQRFAHIGTIGTVHTQHLPHELAREPATPL